MRSMALEVHSSSESGYSLKRETKETQTGFSMRDVAIQTDGHTTCEIGVQTCDRHIPVWLKVCIGVVCSLACLLVLYYITSSISHYKMMIVQAEEKNNNLTDQLQSLTNEHEILKKQLEQKNTTHNQLEISLKECKQESIKYTNIDLNNKLKLCEIQNKDLEDQITKCKTVARYKGNETINLNTTSCKSEKDLEKVISSDSEILKKTIQEYKVIEKNLKQNLSLSEELRQVIENKLNTVNRELLDKERDMNEMKQRLDRSTSEIDELKSSTTNLKADLRDKQGELQISNADCKKQKLTLEQSNDKLNQTLIDTQKSKYEVDTKLKSALEEITERDKYIQNSRKSLKDALSAKDEQKKLYDEVLLHVNEREGKISVLEKEIAKLSLDNDDLKTSKEKCETSISEVMAVTGTRDNVKLTKMEDFSHEKLAEEFREIYDEEYSDADDELRKLEKHTQNGSSEKYLLSIVKMAYELCSTYAIEHKRSIKESITNIDVKTSSHSKRLGDRKESVRRVSIEDAMSAFEMDNISNLTLSTAIRIQQPIIQVLSEIIASEFEIETENQPYLMNYVRKCLELCWMMNMHSDPIVVKFEDTTDPVIFDRKTYKTYENDGEFLDFVVWPPVYVYEGGKLISKGIAEGKDN